MITNGRKLTVVLAAALALSVGCGADKGGDGSGSGSGSGKGNNDGTSGGNGDFDFDLTDEIKDNPNNNDTGNGGGGDDTNCEPNLTGIVRDFQPSHPDFESYSGGGPSVGIVQDMLGDDRKPVYAHSGSFSDPTHGQQVTSKDSFDQWYRDVDGVNQRFEYQVMLTPQASGILSFDSDAFFPINDKGFGNAGNPNNFHFTFELHTEFGYHGGEVFTFKGDDDLWVFINGKLALDLGGLHPREEDSVNLDAIADEFGLKVGEIYRLELFHAERHTNHSNFRIDTTIKFTNCMPIIID